MPPRPARDRPAPPVTVAELLAGLNVVRSLSTHLSTRLGLGVVLVTPDGEIRRVDPGDDESPLSQLMAVVQRDEALDDLFRGALVAMLDTRSTRPVRHPLGFQLCAVPATMPDRAGRLVALPFVTSDAPTREKSPSSSPQRAEIKSELERAGVAERTAQSVASAIPQLSAPVVKHVRELCGLMSTETAQFAESLSRSERRIERLRRAGQDRYGRIIGKSAPMQALFGSMNRIERSDATVYIHGENGTGKELVAAELHEHSRRAGRPFVVQNCSALNDNLLESEMFGHKRGAFTGAVNDKPGLFDLADSGTFFLDEIGDMSPSLQVKLLRVLQEGTFLPVGDTAVRQVDVRVICATNKDLRRMVDEGSFREDLYYRINVIGLRIPPLRERRDDIPILVSWFLRRTLQQLGDPDSRKRFTREAMARLMDYEWPGNVRELENEVERVVVMAGPLVTRMGPDMLSPHIRTRALTAPELDVPTNISLPDALEQIERRMILDALKTAHWNKTRAAEALGVSRRNLIRKVNRYGFDKRSS